MRKIFLVFITLWLIIPAIHAQKVGLVLSGGGAKGMTHIGIIRALEENNIPIDYIAGTSMGAIIGSLYAMGYSPDDMVSMENLALTESTYYILLSLYHPQHGYGIMQQTEQLSGCPCSPKRSAPGTRSRSA